MALETKLVQKLSQSLTMTPQLQQAIKLLQLGRLEYKEALEKELLENPILEEAREDEDRSSFTASQFDEGDTVREPTPEPQAPDREVPAEPRMDWEGYLESFTDHEGAAAPRGTRDEYERAPLESTLTSSESLEDFLISQVRLLDLTKHDRRVAQELIGNLDRNGYLCSSYEEIAVASHSTVIHVEKVAEQLMELEPAGVCARNLQECLYNQLGRLGKAEGLEGTIVLQHLELLKAKKYEQIAKLEGKALKEVYVAVQAILRLEPRPGRPFTDESVRYIVPDIYVHKIAGEYVVTLNEDGLPKLKVSGYYLKLLREGSAKDNPNKAYLHERLKAASWLIKSIHQRQQTIFRVTESIVKFQKEFLDDGIARLKPLVLKEVADDIGMHESTVSRVTTNKYVHTPQGIFELKYFFTTGIMTSEGEVSSSAIKERIRSLIAEESQHHPVSDQKIVQTLQSEKIEIARRTVAKYREALGIPSSSKRKRPF